MPVVFLAPEGSRVRPERVIDLVGYLEFPHWTLTLRVLTDSGGIQEERPPVACAADASGSCAPLFVGDTGRR